MNTTTIIINHTNTQEAQKGHFYYLAVLTSDDVNQLHLSRLPRR